MENSICHNLIQDFSLYTNNKAIVSTHQEQTLENLLKAELSYKRSPNKSEISHKGSNASTADSSHPSLGELEDLLRELKNHGDHNKEIASGKTNFQHIFPTFDLTGKNSSHYTSANQNGTIIHDDTTSFSTILANQALPSSGKYKFSVRIGQSKKTFQKLYVGVCTEDLKGKEMKYQPGYYFMSAFSGHSFLNRLMLVKENVLPKKGQVISVLVNLDDKKIAFEIDGIKVLEGRLYLPDENTNKLYPFICIGEPEASVTFV